MDRYTTQDEQTDGFTFEECWAQKKQTKNQTGNIFPLSSSCAQTKLMTSRSTWLFLPLSKTWLLATLWLLSPSSVPMARSS